ncbi:ribokinase [Frondihabitans sp. VKM Ac-2883]|uniref:ribokinase n=1 Tax=Frondihabitans sp. VKM Ac-2883 TaxID=2783823 RepID=UPI00188A377C|nr:ribokinase [Frondihabitans sp. VKM Ac-2883]MBF4577535.1 ribokinase [Frondihabitans sp. VKM Ac-2883]
MAEASILVIGSINYDYLLTQERLPRRGETFPASSMEGAFGGKGANQAIQAARLGADVEFVGAVGPDENGQKSRANLEAHNVTAILRDSELSTGTGIVHVTGAGDVYATIFEGANGAVDANWVDAQRLRISSAALVIIQNEIPAEANARAVTLAHETNVPVIYNAAPAREVSLLVSNSCTWFVVNEDEAAFYLGRALGEPTNETLMMQAARELLRYCPGVIVTLGRHGSVVATPDDTVFVPSRPTKAVDSTGAGDSFVGAFATAVLEGSSPVQAATAATIVASLTVRGVGAQSSMPMREDIPHEAVYASPSDS